MVIGAVALLVIDSTGIELSSIKRSDDMDIMQRNGIQAEFISKLPSCRTVSAWRRDLNFIGVKTARLEPICAKAFIQTVAALLPMPMEPAAPLA